MDALFILLLLIALAVIVFAILKAVKKPATGARPGRPSGTVRPREED